MRAGIRTALVNTKIFKGVYDMQVPTAKTEKPFCVIKQSSDTKADDWIGYRRNYEIYPYVARGSFTDLDAKVNSVISALDRVLLTDSTETFTTFYTGCGQDYVDEEFEALTRPLYFTVIALRVYGTSEYATEDGWVDGLETLLGNKLTGWNKYTGALPEGYSMPAILIRLISDTIEKIGTGMELERKRIRIHFLTKTISDRETGLKTVMSTLPRGGKVLLGTSDYVIIDDVTSDLEASPFDMGHVTVGLEKITLSKEEGTKIEKVYTRNISQPSNPVYELPEEELPEEEQ